LSPYCEPFASAHRLSKELAAKSITSEVKTWRHDWEKACPALDAGSGFPSRQRGTLLRGDQAQTKGLYGLIFSRPFMMG